MSGHDQLFKELFESFLGDPVCLVAPGLAEHLRLEAARPLPKEQFTTSPSGSHGAAPRSTCDAPSPWRGRWRPSCVAAP